jgi:hypothetical protein
MKTCLSYNHSGFGFLKWIIKNRNIRLLKEHHDENLIKNIYLEKFKINVNKV